MIRINLLGTAKPKKGKRPALGMPTFSGEGGPSIVLVITVILVLTAGGNYWWYSRLNAQHEQLQQELATANSRIQALAGVKARYEEKDKQAKQLKRRFDVIDQLRASQAGPVKMLSMLSDTVSSSDAVWLNSMKEEGSSITLDGVALSNVALANLMTNLKKSGYFKNVELKETAQENFKNLQAFSFTLVCEKAGEKKA